MKASFFLIVKRDLNSSDGAAWNSIKKTWHKDTTLATRYRSLLEATTEMANQEMFSMHYDTYVYAIMGV